MKKIISDTSSVTQYQNFQRVISQLQLGDKVTLELKLKDNGYKDVFVITDFGEAGQLFSENSGEIKQYFNNPNYKIEARIKKLLDKGNDQQSIIIEYDIFEGDSLTPPILPSQNIAQPQNPTSNQNQPAQPQKKTSGCLIVLYVGIACVIGVILLSMLFRACTPDYQSTTSTGASNDSIAVSTTGTTGQKSVDSTKIKKLKGLFKVKKDEFQEHSWVHSKNEPAYRNTNGFFCYFAQDDQGKVSNLRFSGQYAADDWLFVRKLTFNIDGKNVDYIPEKMETDHNSAIWEWYDDKVDPNTFILLFAISRAKKVKVRFHGNQYYDDKILSETSKKNIKNTLEYYVALGGKVE